MEKQNSNIKLSKINEEEVVVLNCDLNDIQLAYAWAEFNNFEHPENIDYKYLSEDIIRSKDYNNEINSEYINIDQNAFLFNEEHYYSHLFSMRDIKFDSDANLYQYWLMFDDFDNNYPVAQFDSKKKINQFTNKMRKILYDKSKENVELYGKEYVYTIDDIKQEILKAIDEIEKM